MGQHRLTLRWEGTFIELCMGRINRVKKSQIDACRADWGKDIQSAWYGNTDLLKALFGADNWWSADDLDHAMGFVFADRPDLEKKLTTMALVIDDTPAAIDPEAIQLSFYAPEAIGPLDEDDLIVCHGTRQEAIVSLDTQIEPPFAPSLITLSFLHYRGYGDILIDLDYDGHDDVRFTFSDTTYLTPQCFAKGSFP